MNTSLALRLKAFRRSLDVLTQPQFSPIWTNQKPIVFGKKRAEAAAMVEILEGDGAKQSLDITGAAEEKAREEEELEAAAYGLAQALFTWFNDQKQETESMEVSLTQSDWVDLPNLQLLSKSQRVIDLAAALVAGPQAAAAVDYGVDAEAVALLTKERKDFADIVDEPSVALSLRKAMTKSLPSAFNIVEKKFGELDSLIVQYGKTATGQAMVTAWEEARIQKGNNGPAKKPEAPAAPAPSA
jgi:hypothetical protein